MDKNHLEQATIAAREYDVFFSIGTSGIVEPAASLAYKAMQQGATIVVNNLDIKTDMHPDYLKINGLAGTILPAIVNQAWPIDK